MTATRFGLALAFVLVGFSASFGCDSSEKSPVGGGGSTSHSGGGGGSSPTSTPAPSKIGTGGYVEAGTWHGYAWTGVSPKDGTSTIAPADFTGVTEGATKLCANGSVGPQGDYSGVGMLGVNLAQDKDGTNPPVNEVAPTGSGITVSAPNAKGSVLRVQLQAADGDKNADHRWCAELTKETQTFKWSDFNTTCWEPSKGTSYDGKVPLSAMVLVVPGSNLTPVDFDFCFTGMAQVP